MMLRHTTRSLKDGWAACWSSRNVQVTSQEPICKGWCCWWIISSISPWLSPIHDWIILLELHGYSVFESSPGKITVKQRHTWLPLIIFSFLGNLSWLFIMTRLNNFTIQFCNFLMNWHHRAAVGKVVRLARISEDISTVSYIWQHEWS